MNGGTEDLITAEAAGTLDGLFRQRVHRTPDRVAYRAYDRAARQWRDFSWNDMAGHVARWRAALAAEALRPGDRVAVLMRNAPEWVMFEQAALSLGLVVVPLYTDDRPDSVAYIVEDSAAALLLVGEASVWRRLAPALADTACLKRVLLLDPGRREGDGSVPDPRVRAVGDWLPERGEPLVERDADPGSLATIVYTSGTTGRPKGVMLSHRNILSNTHAALVSYDLYLEDVLLSFLPLSHTFERTVGYFLPMMAGCTVAYARSVQQLVEDMQTIRPTAMITVPRIFERAYHAIHDKLDKKSALSRWLFGAAARLGWRRFEASQGRGRVGVAGLLWPLLDRMVARQVRQRFGGRMRLVVSGGAALPLPVAKVFIGLGLPIVQGYGMTETSPVVCGNPLDDNDPASVGVPLRGVEVRIGADDELMVCGPGVMMGYWNNHAATAAVIEPDGWLHTGDQARIEGEHIYITGRIKDILVLSNGEKIPPADMEAAIVEDPLFEQVMVVGEGRSYLTALLVLNPERWFAEARASGVDPLDPASLDSDAVHKQVIARLRRLLHDFPGYAKIRRVCPMLEAWSVEGGLLTPTMKVRRKQVLDRFAEQIEAMYAD